MKTAKTALGAAARRMPRLSRTTVGVLICVAFLVFLFGLYNKERVSNTAAELFGSTDTVKAEFPRDHKLRDHKSDVKIGGVIVGSTTDVERSERGAFIVTMQVEDDVSEKLGSRPSAHIRPTLMLGGRYYVDLQPGGEGEFGGDVIPQKRTSIPVELDQVLQAVTPKAQQGMQAAIGQTDAVLRNGGKRTLRDLLRDAPGTLAPAKDVLQGALGTRPGRDWAEVVGGMRNAAAALTQHQGQLSGIVDSLEDSTKALADGSRPLAASVATMPETMRTTRAGLADLQPTLARLTTTAEDFRPSVEELDVMLSELRPVLRRTRPLLDKLTPLLEDTRPMVERLVPTTKQSTGVLRDLDSPVLGRLQGPVAETVLSPWKGTGRYAGGGSSGNLFYQELGYLASRASQVFGWYDKVGSHARMSGGAGADSVGGAGQPMTLEKYLENLGMSRPGPDSWSGEEKYNDSSDDGATPTEQGAPR